MHRTSEWAAPHTRRSMRKMINGSLPSCCTARARRLTDCCVLLFPSRRLQSSFRRYRYRVGWVCMMYSLELVDRFGLVDGRVWLCSVAVQQSVKTKLIKVRIASFVWDGTSVVPTMENGFFLVPKANWMFVSVWIQAYSLLWAAYHKN